MRDKIKLVSSAGTGHYYTTTKNKRLHPDKMETMKFDPVGAQARSVQRIEDQVDLEFSRAASPIPELPEVETTRRGIEPALIGRCVVDVIVRDRRLRWPIEKHFEAAIRQRTVRGVGRRAKYLLLAFESGTLIVHLGMSGSLRIVDADAPPKAHDHWDLRLDSGKALRFHDPRRFGSALWTQADPLEHKLLAMLAPEPLSGTFDAHYLYRATRKRAVAIKQFIMNSQVVVGVGNIYASESLFRARIAPRTAARSLTRAQAARSASHQGRARRGHRDRRHDAAGLCERRRGTGVFRPAALRVRAGGSPLPRLPDAREAIRTGPAIDLWCAVCQRTGARSSTPALRPRRADPRRPAPSRSRNPR